MTITILAQEIAQDMITTVDASTKSYLESDDFESVFETCFDKKLGHLKGDAYTREYQLLIVRPEIEEAFNVCKELRDEAREQAIDDMNYHTNPMQYYGLKNSDFI